MTGFMHEKEFSRKSFLKGGGALIVGFSLAGAGLAGKAQAADSPFASNAPYDRNAIDSWITIHADNTAALLTGRAEMGQGTSTGMLQILGEELNMDISQLRWVMPDTNVTPNTASTSASNSMRQYGSMVRAAAVSANQALLSLASANLGVPVSSLTVKSGVVSGGGKSVKYGDLLGDKPFNAQMSASYKMNTVPGNAVPANAGLEPGASPAKPVSQYTLVTQRVPRIDIPDMVAGTFVYVHNIKVPGMLHGRIVRPRGQPGYGFGTPVVSVDESSIKHLPGTQLVRKGDFLGVVSAHEYDAIQAAAQLKVKWADPPKLSGSGNMWKQMRDFDSAGQVRISTPFAAGDFNYNVNPEKVGDALASAAKVVSATYAYPYNGHMPLGPLCVVADVTANGAIVYSNSQGVFGQRTKLASVLGLPANVVRVKFYEGSSSYGSGSHYDEAAEAAALMSQLAGKPVRLQYMRWDEHGWDNYGPPHLVDVRGGIDAKGNIVGIDYTTFNHSGSYDVVVRQATGTPVAEPGLATVEHWGVLGSQYNLPTQRVTVKTLPVMNNYFKTGALRAPEGPQDAFAYEQLIDELAYAANMDPYLFRVQNITKLNDPNLPWFYTDRWLGSLNAAAKAANWQPRVANSVKQTGNVVVGRGISITTHSWSTSGVVAEIEVNKKTGKIVAKHLYISQDAGLTVNPALVENQLIGGAMQGVSKALLEEVTFDKSRVTSLDWVTYPVLRFKDHPNVTAIVVQRTDQRSGGSGEVPMPTTIAAIANAFFDATGVRIRQAPLTPGRVRAVLKAAGVA
jgi:CO/xanthine dehydrogenase Mo-binding subunit